MAYDDEQLLLPDDVIIEILSWLPSETLVKFTSVCRSWYSTIRDPKFIAKHESHNGYNLVIATPNYSGSSSISLQVRLLQINNPEIVLQDMELMLPYSSPNYIVPRYHVAGSCNGLLCCTDSGLDDAPIQLCNPYIRWEHLMQPYRLNNTSNNRVNYGVGFDQYSNDYKVVKFSFNKTAIYSVKNKSWRMISAQSRLNTSWSFQVSVFLRGFIHWTAYKCQTWSRTIMSFDVCNEVFEEIELPEVENKCYDRCPRTIYVVKGCLCLMVAEVMRGSIDDKVTCHIWTMKKYGVPESWTKQLRVVYGCIIPRSMKLTLGGKIIFYRYEDTSRFKRMILLYDPETDVYKTIGQVQHDGASVCSVGASISSSNYEWMSIYRN